MKLKRKKELQNAVLSHIINTIKLNDLKIWKRVEFISEDEEDVVKNMFEREVELLLKRVS